MTGVLWQISQKKQTKNLSFAMRFTKMLPLVQRKNRNELFNPQKVVKEKSLHIFFVRLVRLTELKHLVIAS